MRYFIKTNGILSLTQDLATPPAQPHLPFDLEATYNFRKPDFDSEDNPTMLVETITHEELVKKAIEIDMRYTKMIFDIQMKHIGKKNFEPDYVIPQIAIDEVAALRQQCNDEILAITGLSDYAYRQSNPKLATQKL